VELIRRDTRRYAKRQLTFFEHQFPETEWLPPDPPLAPLVESMRQWRKGEEAG